MHNSLPPSQQHSVTPTPGLRIPHPLPRHNIRYRQVPPANYSNANFVAVIFAARASASDNLEPITFSYPTRLPP